MKFFKKTKSLKSACLLMLLILPLQMLAAELGEAGKRLAALPYVSKVEPLQSTCFPRKIRVLYQAAIRCQEPAGWSV